MNVAARFEQAEKVGLKFAHNASAHSTGGALRKVGKETLAKAAPVEEEDGYAVRRGKPLNPTLAIGLMSGTSRDGIDAALIRTDGEGEVDPITFVSLPYGAEFRARLAEACLKAMSMASPASDPLIDAVAQELTAVHADTVRALLAQAEVAAADIGVIGFHGHTVAHRPERHWTWQIGDGAALARMTGITVVSDLRSADVAAGGQGAPLLPVYHRALAQPLEKPVVILNLGGVANITFIGEDGELIAFDTGMASALIDNWVQEEGNATFDAGGALAGQGRIDEAILTSMLDHPWFDQPPHKSLDREDFTIATVRGLSLADGAATDRKRTRLNSRH